jgi:hypothetical protein
LLLEALSTMLRHHSRELPRHAPLRRQGHFLPHRRRHASFHRPETHAHTRVYETTTKAGIDYWAVSFKYHGLAVRRVMCQLMFIDPTSESLPLSESLIASADQLNCVCPPTTLG